MSGPNIPHGLLEVRRPVCDPKRHTRPLPQPEARHDCEKSLGPSGRTELVEAGVGVKHTLPVLARKLSRVVEAISDSNRNQLRACIQRPEVANPATIGIVLLGDDMRSGCPTTQLAVQRRLELAEGLVLPEMLFLTVSLSRATARQRVPNGLSTWHELDVELVPLDGCRGTAVYEEHIGIEVNHLTKLLVLSLRKVGIALLALAIQCRSHRLPVLDRREVNVLVVLLGIHTAHGSVATLTHRIHQVRLSRRH